ncbi:MAG: hypothetical protein ACJAYE_000894 [Candidatus Azotimanducaceae bacterium]|jgi:hypothetical protein
MLEDLGHINNPRERFKSRSPAHAYFTFDHTTTYFTEPRTERLQVLWFQEHTDTFVSIFQRPEFSIDQSDAPPIVTFQQLLEKYQLPSLKLNAPWPLETVRIAKPWGAELWYTGIEDRGVCSTAGIPLPWLTDLLPSMIIGSAMAGAPLLLKILDPLPDQNLGDLYFELHEEKIEVYIVTSIDTMVWPDEVGKIRYGFDQTLRANYPDDRSFRTAYLRAVANYRDVRITIDEQLDTKRSEASLDLNSEVPVSLMKTWLAELPVELSRRESTLRDAMNRFTHLRDIRVGDVITVEPFFPHSLQHGVRVVEFQTASYERHILAFGQKVLTQNHWDTEQAVGQAILALPDSSPLEVLVDTAGVKVESIAKFSAFTAIRISITAGQRYVLEESHDYRLAIGISGTGVINQNELVTESAFLIPAQFSDTILAKTDLVLLIAAPTV